MKEMEELIKYFEKQEARIAELEKRLTVQEERIAVLVEERNALRARLGDVETAQQEVKPKLAAIAGHLNRMNEILEEAQLRTLTPEDEQPVSEEPETVVEPEVQEVQEEPEIQAPEPAVEPEPMAAPESEPVAEEPEPVATPESKPVVEEQASPKAAIYGKAVDDIRLAISLGDRFLYQRELFGQNAELMQRTLDELNKLGSFDEALHYINSKFEWDTESNTYQQFLVTLHRRFG